MKIDNKGPSELSVPENIIRPEVQVHVIDRRGARFTDSTELQSITHLPQNAYHK